MSQHRYYQDSDAPRTLTQEGIAEATQIGRNNVSKVVATMAKAGDVDVVSKHVKGLPTVRRVCYLTAKGFQNALRLKEEIESAEIRIADFDGSEHAGTIGSLNKFLPRPYQLLELAMGVSRGVFDCASFHEMKVKEERRFVDFTDRKPTVRVFLGREGEIGELSDFLASDTARIMVVHGIPGIGKSTLLAKFSQEIRERTNIFWYRVHEWMTLRLLLAPLSEFFSQLGRKGLERYLAQTSNPEIGEVCNVVSEDLKDLAALIILDDVQRAEKGIVDLLAALVSVLETLPGVRMICASRELPSFYSRSAVFSGTVRELALEGLDKKSSVQIMKRKAIPEKYYDDLYRSTKGHPLFLELVEEPGGILDKNVRMFIEQEVHSKLGLPECRILEMASVFRYPVNLDAFFVMEEEAGKDSGPKLKGDKYDDYVVDYDTIDDLLAKSLLQESMGRTIGMHDLIRDFFYGRLPPRQRALFHRAASRYYVRDPSSPSRVEAMYHALMAGDCKTAISIAAGSGRVVVTHGCAAAFAPLIQKLLSQCQAIPEAERTEILMLRGEISDLHGDWEEALARYDEILGSAFRSGNKRLAADVYRRKGVIALKRSMFDNAFELLDRSMTIASELGDAHTLVDVYYDLGGICERRGRSQEALDYFAKSRDLAKSLGLDLGLGKALYGLGRVCGQLLEHEDAIRYRREALQILERTGDLKATAKVCTSLGNDLLALGRLEDALEMQLKAIELANAAGDLGAIAYAMSNAAATYLEMGDGDRAEEMLGRATPLFTKLNDRVMIATMHLYRGYVHNLRGEWEWAKEEFGESLDILRQIDAPLKLGNWLFEIGQTYVENNDHEEARILLREALELASKGGSGNLRRDVEIAMDRLDDAERSSSEV